MFKHADLLVFLQVLEQDSKSMFFDRFLCILSRHTDKRTDESHYHDSEDCQPNAGYYQGIYFKGGGIAHVPKVVDCCE